MDQPIKIIYLKLLSDIHFFETIMLSSSNYKNNGNKYLRCMCTVSSSSSYEQPTYSTIKLSRFLNIPHIPPYIHCIQEKFSTLVAIFQLSYPQANNMHINHTYHILVLGHWLSTTTMTGSHPSLLPTLSFHAIIDVSSEPHLYRANANTDTAS